MIGTRDPVDMEERIQFLEWFDFWDQCGRPLSREILAAVLRKHSFDVERAADDIEEATVPEHSPVSIPGQWKICCTLTRHDDSVSEAHDPPEMKEFMDGVRDLQTELGLADHRDRPFCDEVIAAAIRSSFWDPAAAADLLIAMSDRIGGYDRSSNLEAKRAAYAKLRNRFPGDHGCWFNRFPEPWHAARGEDETNLV
jgi:hypothetical protein